MNSYNFIFKNGFEDSCSEDADSDGLKDCVETNTRMYVSATNTGTDPHNPDTDDDGLLDGEEVRGTAGGLNLPAMGVNPLHKDMLIEYDWFNDSADGCGSHTHKPTATIISSVRTFFANAAVTNPDGVTGINVIQDYGQGGQFTGGNRIVDSSNPNAFIYGGINFPNYIGYEAANFAASRKGYFHYVLMAHSYDDTNGNTNSSGIATFKGSELMVTLACWAVTSTFPTGSDYIRNTIVHELGHNLGLQHGGFEGCNYKPNYSSVMNYKYQFAGVDTSCVGNGDTTTGTHKLDYSHGDRRTLDEHLLNETLGMCTGTAIPVDWNSDGFYNSAVSVDVNYYNYETLECYGGGTLQVLKDFNDLANLIPAAVSPLAAPPPTSTFARSPLPGVTPCTPIPAYPEGSLWLAPLHH